MPQLLRRQKITAETSGRRAVTFNEIYLSARSTRFRFCLPSVINRERRSGRCDFRFLGHKYHSHILTFFATHLVEPEHNMNFVSSVLFLFQPRALISIPSALGLSTQSAVCGTLQCVCLCVCPRGRVCESSRRQTRS